MAGNKTAVKSEYLSAADLVVEFVKEGIRTGRFRLGDRLPSEAELADEIGVGRSSLREGMNILRAFGLVDIRRGDGTYIDNKTEDNFMEVLGLQTNSSTAEFMILRKVLETGTIALVCPKITSKEIEHLQELTDRLVPENSVEACVDADREFHTTIMNVLGNQMIITLNNMIYMNRMTMINMILKDKTILEDTRHAHQAIVDALRSQDPDACSRAMTIHINHTIGHMIGLNML